MDIGTAVLLVLPFITTHAYTLNDERIIRQESQRSSGKAKGRTRRS